MVDRIELNPFMRTKIDGKGLLKFYFVVLEHLEMI